jgi:hypothetical protein
MLVRQSGLAQFGTISHPINPATATRDDQSHTSHSTEMPVTAVAPAVLKPLPPPQPLKICSGCL